MKFKYSFVQLILLLFLLLMGSNATHAEMRVEELSPEQLTRLQEYTQNLGLRCSFTVQGLVAWEQCSNEFE